MVGKGVKRRTVAASLALLMLASALAAGLHTHTWLAQDDLAAQAAHIPLSVISNPDAPAPEQHWHPGAIFEQDVCVACLLSHQRASFVCPVVVAVAITVVPVLTASGETPAVPKPRSITARAPPFTC
jgi:hypothetical protein